MTLRLRCSALSNEEGSLSRVWEWHEFQRALIGEEERRVFGMLERGESPTESRYFAKTKEEFESDFAFQTTQLDLLSMFGMLACTEAALRVDFIKRVNYRRKDDVSRRFRGAARERAKQIRLADDILDVWQEQPIAGINRAVSNFKGVLNLRDWLAHGRYWKPKIGRVAGYDAVHVFDICSELLQAIGLTP